MKNITMKKVEVNLADVAGIDIEENDLPGLNLKSKRIENPELSEKYKYAYSISRHNDYIRLRRITPATVGINPNEIDIPMPQQDNSVKSNDINLLDLTKKLSGNTR